MIFGHDLSFWVAVLGATLVKLITSPFTSLFRIFATVVSAVFFAVVFTAPVIDWLELPAETWLVPIAALLALTGEGFMRMIMGLTSDSIKLADFINRIRGGK